MLYCSPILSSFQVILLEDIITCRLVAGHKATALQEISQVCQLGQQPPGSAPTTQHTRPGLYCVSVNCVDNAEAQLTTALRLTSHQELWAFMVTNLVSVYIREGGRHQEVLYRVSERISPDHSFPVSSHCLLAAAQALRLPGTLWGRQSHFTSCLSLCIYWSLSSLLGHFVPRAVEIRTSKLNICPDVKVLLMTTLLSLYM